ncbi:hypothetical protein BJY04DRAFT_225187 [Aspergillus karnatakaensis]|uniref:uncharacterized protein n=1 Tax=Aspergillus karnatakaensis TaxID=1810916 RepID=UPI003CCD27C4
MTPQDPFQHLSFECAGTILFYLNPTDIAKCEQVSKGWKDFIHAWITLYGFRLNFSTSSDPSMPDSKDPTTIVRRFKELAAIEQNLLLGRATAVRKIEASENIQFAGDYAVWRRGGEIHWQRLSFKADGSLYASKWLPSASPVFGSRYFVNEEGYFVLQRVGKAGRVDVFSLEDAARLYSLNEPRLRGHELVALGRERIYFATPDRRCMLTVLDLKNGQHLYSAVLGEGVPEAGLPWWRISICRRAFTLLRASGHGERELLLVLEAIPNPGTLKVIDGRNGNIAQEIRTDASRDAYVAMAPGQEEFAVVSHDNRKRIHIWRFSAGSDGLFYEQAIKIINHVNGTSPHLERRAFDPFRYLIASFDGRAVPSIQAVSPSALQADGISGGLNPESGASTDKGAQQGGRRELTLPPRQAHHRARRPFVPDENYTPIEMRFLDGNRLVYRTGPRSSRGPDVNVLFDFGLRVRELKRSR